MSNLTLSKKWGAYIHLEMACENYMWDGIYTEDNTLLEIVNGSIIENAIHAVNSNKPNKITISNSIFQYNYESIDLAENDFSTSSIVGTQFIGSVGLPEPYLGSNTSSHINLTNVNYLLIGSGNYYNEAVYGIKAIMSNYLVMEDVFYNVGYQIFRSAIFNKSSSAEIIGCNFASCFQGIYSAYCYDLRIIENEFNGCNTGLNTVFNGHLFEAQNNTMYFVDHGIESVLNHGVVSIDYNQIFVNQISTSNSTDGISIYGRNSADVDVSFNAVHNMGLYGIYVADCNKMTTANNHVFMEHDPALAVSAYGFFVTGCSNSELTCNTVETDLGVSSQAGKYGISVYDFQSDASIDGNTMFNCQYGLTVEGTCPGTEIKGNTFDNNSEAFVIGNPVTGSGQPASTIDDMTLYNSELPGNLWITPSIMAATSNYFNPSVPQYWCLNSVGATDYPDPNFGFGGPSINPNSQPSLILYQSAPCHLPQLVQQNNANSQLPEILFGEQLVANQIPTINNDLVTEWKAKQKLYESIRTDSSLADTSAMLQAFYAATTGENIGSLTDIKEMVGELGDSILQVNDSLWELKINNAKIINNSIVPVIMPELNEKISNGVYLNLLGDKRSSPTTSEAGNLMFVANQCTYDGGPAVFLARNLLRITYPWLYFDDNLICSNSNLRKVQPGQISALKSVTVYPNPAKDKISFALTEVKERCYVEIHDLAGRFVISAKLTGYVTEIYLQDISQGFYTFIVLENGVPQQHGMFNIVR